MTKPDPDSPRHTTNIAPVKVPRKIHGAFWLQIFAISFFRRDEQNVNFLSRSYSPVFTTGTQIFTWLHTLAAQTPNV